jgi:uncharacterized protein YjbJ (UPF0337 family)
LCFADDEGTTWFTRRASRDYWQSLLGMRVALPITIDERGASRSRTPTGKRHIMGSILNAIDGAADELGGMIKKGIGSIVGNEQMEGEGHTEQKKGAAKRKSARVGEHAKGAVAQASGAVKKNVGKVVGNKKMETEGKKEQDKGAARRKAKH